MRTLRVPRTAPVDLFMRTGRVLTGRQAAGVVPGELVDLLYEDRPGAPLVPGFVYCLNTRDDIVIVAPDH